MTPKPTNKQQPQWVISTGGLFSGVALVLFLLFAPTAITSTASAQPIATPVDIKAVQAIEARPVEAKKDDKQKKSSYFAEIKITGGYSEGPKQPGLFGANVETLQDVQKRLLKAKNDKSIDGVLLKISIMGVSGAQYNELKQTITEVQKSGKPVYAWMEMVTNNGYLLATCCDKIFMPESGVVMISGMRAEVGFYKNMFDKLDIAPQVLRVGKFKAAAEPFTRTKMSPEFRSEIQNLLDFKYELLTSAISKSRKIDKAAAQKLIDSGPHTAKVARKAGLLDGLLYEDQLVTQIATDQNATTGKLIKKYGKKKVDTDFEGFNGMIKMMNLIAGVEPKKRVSRNPKIAIIYANGNIMPGKGSDGVMGSDTIIAAVQKANKDKTVKAIVLRVNSPGGSALASDLMWHALEKVDKPFVVSMGNVAASGGYYIAMGADHIYAEPGTVTGSIGVVGMQFALNGLYEKMGITTDVVTRGGNSGTISMTMKKTDSEHAALVKMMKETYVDFTTKAAKGRNMKIEKLLPLAGGRIYTGEAALKVGLVDELGTLKDAIAHAKKLAKFKAGEKVELLELPKPPNPFAALFGGGANSSLNLNAFKQNAEQNALETVLPKGALQHLKRLKMMERMMATDRRLLVMPFHLEVQ